MAEIKIEKKKPIWPWVLVILIILAAIYFFWYYNDNNYDTDDQIMDNDTITQIDDTEIYDNDVRDSSTLYAGTYGTIRNEQTAADFLNFVDAEKDSNKAMNNEYYRTAFVKLITATKRTAEIKNVDVTSNLDNALKNTELLTNDSTSSQKTEDIRKTAVEVSTALKKIQQDSFNDLSSEANAVEIAANNINARGTINEESTSINSFLDKSAILLQKIYQKEENNL